MIWLAILLSLISASDKPTIDIFYHYQDRLFIGEDEVKVRWEGEDYGVFQGSVSSDGRYISGCLVNPYWSSRLDAEKRGGIVEFFSVDSITFVVMELASSEIVYSVQGIDFLPSGVFSPQEDYVLIGGSVSQVVKLSTSESIIKIEDYVLNPKWIGARLYFVAGPSDHVVLKELDCVSGAVASVFSLPAETGGSTVTFQYAIVDPSTVLRALRGEAATDITLFHNGDSTFADRWSSAQFHGSEGSTVLISGGPIAGNTEADFGLFELDVGSLTTRQIVSSPQINRQICEYRPCCCWTQWVCRNSSAIYTVCGALDSDRNLIWFDEVSGVARRLTDSGFVTGPIGVCSK